jgi:hypothetical protein
MKMETKNKKSTITGKPVMKQSSTNTSIHHTQKLKVQMQELISHLRNDVGEVTEPKAQALFETSAEVLTGLAKAFTDYENQSEEAWRTEPMAARPKGGSTSATRR